MSRSNNNRSPKQSDSLRPTGAEDAAKSLLCLALADVVMNHVGVTVNVHPTTRQQHELKIPILPPWQLEDMVLEEVTGDDSSSIVENGDIEEVGSNPPSVKVIQWSNDVSNKNEDVDDEDDDDLSLSLYVGAENDEHHLVEARSYKDLSNISFAEVAIVVNDSDKQGIFPVLLHHILSSGQHDDSIMWFSHGRAFAIIDREKFFAEVAPLYFCTYEHEPFMKWIEAYGFQQVKYIKGNTEMVVFYHERFLRFRSWLAFTMKQGSHDDDIPSPRSVDVTQEVFQYFDQIPALQDVLIPYSALVAHPPTAYEHRHGKATPVAHAHLPNLHAFLGWHVGHSRDEDVSYGNGIHHVNVKAEKYFEKYSGY